MTELPSRLPLGATADDVRQCMRRILDSPQFAASERLKRFLTFAVEQSLDSADGPKEYEVGVRVYDRGDEFDPSHDSIVRTEAARLRKRLDEYYESEGRSDAIRIEIPRGSYRARFTRQATAQVAGGDAPVALTTPVAAGARRPVWWAVAATLTISALAAIWSTGLATVSREHPGRQSGYVLVAEFLNRTGDAALDDAVESAVEFHLTSHAGLQPLPSSRVDDALRLMAKAVDTPLSSRVAREVALRDGNVGAVLEGALRGRAAPYELTARLTDPVSGRVIDSYVAEVRDGQFLPAARSVADWVRAEVGGPMQPSAKLESVTTASLKAVQLYSQAYKEGLRGRWSHAEKLLEQAVIEDAEFASAHLLLAWARRNQGKAPAEWRRALAAAIDHSARATEIERLFIIGSNHTIERRPEEARVTYESLLQLAPDHFWARSNLLHTLNLLDPSHAATHLRHWADLRPNDTRVQLRVAWQILHESDDVEQASVLIERARQHAHQGEGYLLPTADAFVAWKRGDTEQAVRLMASVPSRTPLDNPFDYGVRVGMPMLGLGMTARGLEAISGLSPGTAARWEAWFACQGGDLAHARAVATRLTREPPNPLNAVILVRLGRLKAAEALIAARHQVPPLRNAAFDDALWDVPRAEWQIALGRHAEAEKTLTAAIPVLEPFRGPFVEYFLAVERLAELLVHRGKDDEAVLVLDRAVRQRSRVFANSLSFWASCARRLIGLLEQRGDTAAADAHRAELDRVFAGADVTPHAAARASITPTNR